jgi:hypothetical protein
LFKLVVTIVNSGNRVDQRRLLPRSHSCGKNGIHYGFIKQLVLLHLAIIHQTQVTDDPLPFVCMIAQVCHDEVAVRDNKTNTLFKDARALKSFNTPIKRKSTHIMSRNSVLLLLLSEHVVVEITFSVRPASLHPSTYHTQPPRVTAPLDHLDYQK